MKMKVVEMKLKGSTWVVSLINEAGTAKASWLIPRQGVETLADAAVRVEDLLRQLQEGAVKPLNLAV